MKRECILEKWIKKLERLFVSLASAFSFALYFARPFFLPFLSQREHPLRVHDRIKGATFKVYSMVAWSFLISSSVFPSLCISSTTRLSRKIMQLFSNMVPKRLRGSRSPRICLAR